MDELREMIEKNWRESSSDKLLPLMTSTVGPGECYDVLESFMNHQITMGSKVARFEESFREYIGTRHAAMVNSGSSANLLALSVLSNPTLKNRIRPGDEIIVPSVTWSTTIYPIVNIGAIPVFADVGEDYQMSVESVKQNTTKKTKAIFAVHLLGDVCDIKALQKLAKEHNLFLIEDCCEALGSEVDGRKVGTFGDFSTFSSYFSHHISTGEGGVLCTNNDEYADLAKILRAHGYVRHSLKKEEYVRKHPNIDPRFLFVNLGYNFRPMELQGGIGLRQLEKANGFASNRRKFALYLLQKLEKYRMYLKLPYEKSDTVHSWFAFPITIKENAPFTLKEFTAYLEASGIETRPVVCGNFAEQPSVKLFDHRRADLSHAEYIMRNSFYIGIHPEFKKDQLDKVAKVFDGFFLKLTHSPSSGVL